MKRLVVCILFLGTFATVFGKEYADSAIYQGLLLKVDVGNTIFEMTRSKMDIQSYEMAMSLRLNNRLFPTLEGGYVTAKTHADGGRYEGDGAFLRAGLDIYPMKGPADQSNITVGVRYANALQHYQFKELTTNNLYWNEQQTTDIPKMFRYDGWLEIVASLQVQVYKRFYMGWCIRLKVLFTDDKKDAWDCVPTYIPGFGYKETTNYSFNYYIGIKI